MRACARTQAGLGLVELMVATVLGLLVVAGVGSVYLGLKAAWQAQDELAALHDSERLAIGLLTQVVREAGFRPDPWATTTLPAETNATFGDLALGQTLMGTSGTPDTLTVRFQADGNGVARDCTGDGSYARGAAVTNRITVDANGNLSCKVNANAPQPLVAGIAGLSVSYGVDTAAGCSPCQPRQYLNAAQVTAAAAWNRVRVVRLAIRFSVPRGNPAWVEWVQNVGVMNT